MKKFLSGLFAALLLTAGFVSLSGQSAQAAPSRACDQYTTCFTTKIVAKGSTASAKAKPSIKVTVRAAGNVHVRGTVTVKAGGKTATASYKDKTVTVTLPRLAPGKYKATISFAPAKDARVKASTGTASITVKKK
jgi:hypothetical protein